MMGSEGCDNVNICSDVKILILMMIIIIIIIIKYIALNKILKLQIYHHNSQPLLLHITMNRPKKR